jgi:hypothetical protein
LPGGGGITLLIKTKSTTPFRQLADGHLPMPGASFTLKEIGGKNSAIPFILNNNWYNPGRMINLAETEK